MSVINKLISLYFKPISLINEKHKKFINATSILVTLKMYCIYNVFCLLFKHIK